MDHSIFFFPKDAGWSWLLYSAENTGLRPQCISPSVSWVLFLLLSLSLTDSLSIFSFILILFLFSYVPSHVVSLFPFLSSKLLFSQLSQAGVEAA